jgi:deazaflavin-dependent oxidoreductase (nitroreductase family)
MPGIRVVVHRGRRTGRQYRTPVSVFRSGPDLVVALTYGPRCDWVRNVTAAGECDLEDHGRVIHLVDPRVVTDERRTLVPKAVRPALRLLGATDFLVLSPGGPGAGARSGT